MRLAPVLLATLMLAGCLHAPVPAVVATPLAAATQPGSYRLAGATDGASVDAAVSAALAEQGWRPAAGTSAAFVILASFGDRPAPVGAFVPSAGGGEPTWVAERVPPRPWTVFKRGRRTLTLVLLDPATGRELRRATARLDYWRGTDPDALRRLATSAAAALSAP